MGVDTGMRKEEKGTRNPSATLGTKVDGKALHQGG